MIPLKDLLQPQHTSSFDPLLWERSKASDYNKLAGNLNESDGYNCTLCNNKGHTLEINVVDGFPHKAAVECKCMVMRRTLLRLKRSGMSKLFDRYTFDRFKADHDWQNAIKCAAMEYATNPTGSFFIGGQSGAGKTHLCTAICHTLLLNGKQVQYMLWVDDSVRLKAMITSEPEYTDAIAQFKTADVLYIDDLFKTMTGHEPKPTDVRLAFEIINCRAISQLPTIISSEWTSDDLVRIDPALGGRITEMAGPYVITITHGANKNYRLTAPHK